MKYLSLFLFSALSALVVGCGTAPREQFYTLNAPSLANGEAGSPLLVVAQVSLPEAVDRPQIVIREAQNQVNLLEQQRWASSLQSQFTQALTGHLQAALPQWQLAARQQHANREAKWTLWLDVHSFELSAKQGTRLEVSWSLRSSDGKQAHKAQSSLQQACVACDTTGLVAAQEKAIAQLAKEISVVALRLHTR